MSVLGLGATVGRELIYVLTPMALPGIASNAAAQRDPGLERGVLDAQSLDLRGHQNVPLRLRSCRDGPSAIGDAGIASSVDTIALTQRDGKRLSRFGIC
jgi:hypothetical protein